MSKFNETGWTPCKHFGQCIGYCPTCLVEKQCRDEMDSGVPWNETVLGKKTLRAWRISIGMPEKYCNDGAPEPEI